MRGKLYIILLIFIFLLGGVLGYFVSKHFAPKPIIIHTPTENKDTIKINPNKLKINTLIDYIETQYIDKINTDSIIDLTVSSILKKLDPHSSYISNADIQEVTENVSGQFVGLGIRFYMYKDTISVIKTIDNSDAFRKGISFGDRILMANNDTLFGKNISSEKVKSLFRGEINSKVKLTIYRKNNDSLFTLEINRNRIPIKSVDYHYKVNDTLGYIRINRFAENTRKEFIEKTQLLEKEGVTSIILDLRNNTGGLLKAGIEIADEFLPKGKIIVLTKNNRNETKKTYASNGGIFEKNPVFVLVNESTASASEIVAGALQDNDRAIIIGRRTFGKGLIQSEMPLPDGSSVRLTTGRYYTPTGRSIQKPYKRNSKRQLTDNQDSIKFKTEKGKIVYGGGGIYPDSYIPMDFTPQNYILNEVFASGMGDYFLFEYLDSHTENLQKPEKQYFIKNYEIPKNMLTSFVDFLSKRNISIDFRKNKNEIERYLKASLAEIWYNEDLSAKIRDENDFYIQKCLHFYQENHKNSINKNK